MGAKAFDKQMLELRKNVSSEVTRCFKQYDHLQTETRWSRIELHAQTMASSALAGALDKQMFELRKNVRTELTRCSEQCDQLQNEIRWSRIERDREHEQLEVLFNELHTQRKFLHAQTMASSAMGEAFDKLPQVLADLVTDIEQLKATKADKL